MDFGEGRALADAHEEEALAAAHDAEVAALKERYAGQLTVFVRDLEGEMIALRRRSARVLARIVAQFERERALSVARFQLSRERLRRLGPSRGVVGKA
jgi:hypothetical protein